MFAVDRGRTKGGAQNARPSWHTDYKWITRFKPSMVLIDNMGLKFTVTNPDTNQQRSRHLDMRLFKIRDYIKGQCARVVHIDTTDNIADMFTKPLPKSTFLGFRKLLMTVAIPPRLRDTAFYASDITMNAKARMIVHGFHHRDVLSR